MFLKSVKADLQRRSRTQCGQGSSRNHRCM